jgi:3-dehydroquinate synthase
MGHLRIQSLGYDIVIGSEAFEELNVFLNNERYKQSKLFVLVDENTLHSCLSLVTNNVPRLADAHVLEVESGEDSKTISVCTRLWRALGELGAERQDVLVNLGGGVIGDMGGFVASTYKRGIDFIQVPTTLLSQVDASVGGKVGVDLDHLKNEVGVFNTPKAVFIYPDFLKTLSRREMMSGFAEVVKHGLIADKSYWNYLQNANAADGSVWYEMIERSVDIKNNIVKADPLEKNIRKALNFGHTIGHAVESYFLESSSKSLLHGEAIAIGMIAEAYLSYRKNFLSEAELVEIQQFILSRFGHVEIDLFADHRLFELMKKDKKNTNGELNFTLLNGIGGYVINQVIDVSLVKEALAYYRNPLLTN